jgi:hypothetical protein
MQTSMPVFNESLARGLVQRTLRETSHRQVAAMQRADSAFAPTRRRRGPVFRALVNFMDGCLEDRILVRELIGEGKHAHAHWLYWEVVASDDALRIGTAIIEARNPGIKEAELLRVSRHALQRLFQRLRTDDPTEALAELVPAALSAAHLQAKAIENGERYQVHLEVPTPLGDAVIVWDAEADCFLVKTWIHRDSMNDWRGERHDEAVRCDDRLCV